MGPAWAPHALLAPVSACSPRVRRAWLRVALTHSCESECVIRFHGQGKDVMHTQEIHMGEESGRCRKPMMVRNSWSIGRCYPQRRSWSAVNGGQHGDRKSTR